MLVLTRKIGEEIVINGNTRISIQRIRGGRVRVAIDAPEEVAVLRGELVFDTSSIDDETDVSSLSRRDCHEDAAGVCFS